MAYFKALERSEASKKPAKVAICIPHTGKLYTRFVLSTLLPLLRNDQGVSWRETHLITQRNWSISASRNAMVKISLEQLKTDYVFFIDADQLFSNNVDPNVALRKLLDMNVPIASGITRLKKNSFSYAAYKADYTAGKLKPIESLSERLLEVDCVGMFCCLIKREVFERMRRPYFVFNDIEDMGEDAYFCMNAQALGYKIFVNSQVQLDHAGDYVMQNDMSVKVLDDYTK